MGIGYSKKEIKSISNIGLHYFSDEKMVAILNENLLIEKKYTKEICLKFSSPDDILRHLKNTGVNGVQTHIWTKSKYIEFVERYNQFYNRDNKVQLTYHPMFYYCRKKLQ